ncbi:MAG: hypothetical protein HY709_03830, partial [Candidatus Latescibacteria bacterium]|nr:hypothetical protein [Candidatus Latescibacterota bacterium]
HGVAAAKAAGMRCVAVTNSYPANRLKEADQIIASFDGYRLTDHYPLFFSLRSLNRHRPQPPLAGAVPVHGDWGADPPHW